MTRRLYTLLYLLGLVLTLSAQRPQYGKMSPVVRQMVRETNAQHHRVQGRENPKVGSFLVRLAAETVADEVLSSLGGRSLASVGTIHVVSLPLRQLGRLSQDPRVERIESGQRNQLANDSMPLLLNAIDAYEGVGLPQAYTGKGVVVGVMDVGFDLTHPTFFSCDTTEYRIRRLWDMLSQDTVGSPLYVGRDFTTREELLQLGCCRDGHDLAHGTHTTGTAAGSGYDSPYQGMAPESDICLVANAVSDDIAFIDSADVYKYSFATDALGFKYIFDYAKSVGKPCVISFSEGSGQDFWGYDQLYYEMLDSLMGPGRIIVSAAGNNGRAYNWFRKPKGEPSAGAFLYGNSNQSMITFKSSDQFDIRLVAYGDSNDTLTISTTEILEAEDSVFTTAISIYGREIKMALQTEAYPSCYNPAETCYDLTLISGELIGRRPISFEVLGQEADVEVYRVSGLFVSDERNPALCAGQHDRSILSPSSAPRVICVGATEYRPGVLNYKGDWMTYEVGDFKGERCTFSSMGPTFDGRIKPDVMAPGVNIISSYNSFYLEKYPDAWDVEWAAKRFEFNKRTYAWTGFSGTSMSCPAVAGAIALWLQANPLLTPEDVMGVIARTSRHFDPDMSYPNNVYGYGELDVYAGLLDVLNFNKIADITPRLTPAQITVHDGALHVCLPEETTMPLRLRVYALSGKCVASLSLPAGRKEYEVPLSLSRAVYAVQLDGHASLQGSTLVRL